MVVLLVMRAAGAAASSLFTDEFIRKRRQIKDRKLIARNILHSFSVDAEGVAMSDDLSMKEEEEEKG